VRKTSRRYTLAATAMVAVLGLLATACGDDDDTDSTAATTTQAETAEATTVAPSSSAFDELVAAATEEGKITIYSSQGLDPLNALAAQFEEEYPGIDVEVVRGIDGDLAPKVEAEHQTGNGIADMYVSASLSWVQGKVDEGGWFLEPVGPELTGEGDYDAAQYVHEGGPFEVGAALLTFAWNTDLFEGKLAEYSDLIDPELEGGKIGVIEPSSPSIVDFYLYLEDTYGEEFVEQLAAQEPRIYPSALPMGEALAAGEIAAATFVVPQVQQKAAGAPVDFAVAASAWGARYFGMILESGEHPNAAQLFANYMVSAAGQETIAVSAGSVLPDIPGTLITNDKVRKQDLAALTAEKVAAYQEKWNSLFR
jgi:iron(III) transport system substrate-binding protein